MTAEAIPQLSEQRATAAGESSLVRFLRRHPLAAFYIWFFTVGQAIVFVPVLAPWLFGRDVPTEPFIIASTFLGLLLPALVITRIADGPEALRSLVRRSLRVLVPARWYAVALGVPLVMTAIVVATSGTPDGLGGSALASALVFGFLVQLVVVFVTVNWLEEIAWMGFVQARLQDRHSAMQAAAMTGVVFGLGHISLAFEDGPAAAISFMAILIVVSIGFRALQGWLYNRTGRSLFLVGVLHAGANAVNAGSVMGDGVLPRLYANPPSGLVFPLLGVLGLIVIAATRSRLGIGPRREATTPPNIVGERSGGRR